MNADEIFAEMVARGFCTAAQAAEAGHPVTDAGRRDRRIHWANSGDPDIRAAFEAGRLHGLHEYDRELIAALSRTLGNGKTTTVRAAADWHEKNVNQARRRALADAGDADLLEEGRRHLTALAAADLKRQKEAVAIGQQYKPIGGARPGSPQWVADWQTWRGYCSPSVWERICREYADAGQPLPTHLSRPQHHLQVAA